MDAKKKTILAVSLILLWAGMTVWQWRLLKGPVRVPLMNVTGSPSVGTHEPRGTGLRVNLDLLVSTSFERQTSFAVSRNIFSMPRPDGTFEVGNGPASVSQPGSASAEASSQQDDALKLEQYRYLGFLRVGDKRRNKDIAVLRKDDEVLVLEAGERVDDHFILKAINSESVTIRNTGTQTDQTVPLSEESPEESIESMGQE